MSGFIGIVNAPGKPVDPTLLMALAKSLAFRGPDGLDTFTDGTFGFGHALLQTNDARPHKLSIAEPGADTWIISDARLDGRAELIAEFAPNERLLLNTASDAALILHSYRRWGDNLLAHLTGDFSFAIWDRTRKRLLCARDPLGVKPFFFTWNTGCLVFSNTLDCVRAHPEVPDDLNHLALADFLLFGFMKDLSATAFARIQRLSAGHCLTYEMGAVQVRRYWTPDWSESLMHRRASDLIEHFHEVLQRAVADRVTSFQTGVLMSGGLDSTAVAAIARDAQTRLKAFTVVYDRLIPDEERYYSGEAASFLNVPIEYLAADDYDLYENGGALGPRTPEPVDSPLEDVFIEHMRRVRNFSPVALSGQGGDAIFAIPAGLGVRMLGGGQVRQLGRGAWQYLCLRRRIPPLGFRGSLRRLFSHSPDSVAVYPPWLNPDFESRLGLRERWIANLEAREPQAAPEILLTPFWASLFEGYDPGVSGIPVEVRHPLLDLRVIRFCMSLDPVPWWIDKTLLRVAMRDQLPESICFRPKAPVNIDPVTVRLPGSGWINTWAPTNRLAEFVVREKIPQLSDSPGAPPWSLRPLALNRWLSGINNG